MSRISLKWILAVYAAALCGLAPLRHLWLDEWLQLSDTYHEKLYETIGRVSLNPGGVPFVYLVQNVFINTFGHTLYSARVLSILFALGGLAGLVLLTRLLGTLVDWQWVALGYAILPITLRYALEVRQYGPALSISIWAAALLVALDRWPTLPRMAFYALFLTLGLYSHPFTAFVLLAQMAWAFRRPCASYVLPAGAVSVLLFLPWYLFAHSSWSQAYSSPFQWKTAFVFIHELSGGGYLLTVPLLALAVYGYRQTIIPQHLKLLLLLWILLPLPLVLAANILFRYFFAIRQLVFIVPPLCILAVEGLRHLPKALPIPLALIALYYDFRWFSEP